MSNVSTLKTWVGRAMDILLIITGMVVLGAIWRIKFPYREIRK